ncbi:MAG TPA: Crp/Fnr family transcriptional regulator [Candidatus Caenarcaniphilales bacterium]
MTIVTIQPSMTSNFQYQIELSNLRQQTFNRRDLVPLRSNYLWRIERGAARTLTCGEAGDLITLGLWGPGDVIGKPLSRINPYQIECLTSVEASLVPSQLWQQVLDTELRHAQQAEELLSIVHCKSADLCLMQLLLWLAQKFGCEVNQGKLITLRLTHQEIAETTGMTRVTVTRLLNQFEREGRIGRCRQHLILLHH